MKPSLSYLLLAGGWCAWWVALRWDTGAAMLTWEAYTVEKVLFIFTLLSYVTSFAGKLLPDETY